MVASVARLRKDTDGEATKRTQVARAQKSEQQKEIVERVGNDGCCCCFYIFFIPFSIFKKKILYYFFALIFAVHHIVFVPHFYVAHKISKNLLLFSAAEVVG